jgi:hypothetical protein
LADAALKEFGCVGEIPTRTITIDGNPNDWSGIPPFMTDASGDSACETGTDIKSIYLANDDCFLYWRMDTWSGQFHHQLRSNGDYVGPGIVFYSLENGIIQKGVNSQFYSFTNSSWDHPTIGILDENTNWQLYDQGEEYGAIDSVAEGKIPLELFEGFTFNPPLAGYHTGIGNAVCDELESPMQIDLNFDSTGCGISNGERP